MVAQPNYGLSTDTTLGGNSPSDIISPSEKAIKTYVDNHAELPSQAGNSGKFLTTNGTLASWATIDIPPEVTEATVSGWGFTKNAGTVTSVNNVQPVGGNITLSIPADTADLTNGAGFITSSALNGYATETWVGEQGFLTSVPDATTSSKGLVQPDGTTITINNGVISASGSAPSNMVTTNTAQDITAKKTFKADIQQNGSNFLIYDSNSTPNYAGRISSTTGNRRNITISGGGNYGSEIGEFKIGYEGAGTYYDMQGVFVKSTPSTASTYTSDIGIKLGSLNSRASISGNGGQVKITANALYPQKNYLKVANNSLTYIDNSGTSHDLLAVSTPSWGDITGTLSNQTDLQSALDAKQDSITSSAMLSSDLVDDTNHTHKFATAAQLSQIATNTTNISTIDGKIPAEATTTNQLADKAFVNSSIATNTANFIGTFNSVAELEAYTGTLTNNDYAFVATTDTAGNTLYDRYKYNAGTQEWLFEYELNNSSFTAAQWGSINSGITSSDVSLIGTALQPNDNVSELNNDAGYITSSALSNLANKDLSNLSTTGNSKFQAPLVSGTNIKTVNGNSLLGSGNISIDSLPSQSGNAGKFLTTNGTAASWADTTKVTFRDWSVA